MSAVVVPTASVEESGKIALCLPTMPAPNTTARPVTPEVMSTVSADVGVAAMKRTEAPLADSPVIWKISVSFAASYASACATVMSSKK